MASNMIAPDIIRHSPNYALGPQKRRAIIIHSTRSGILGNDDWTSTLNWFDIPGKPSSHWLVGRDGRKARIVADELIAFHAGSQTNNPNLYTFGIELEQPTIDTPFTEEQLRACAAIVRDYCLTYEIPMEHVWGLTNGERGIIGHDETEQGKAAGKSDPGPLFPWDTFLTMVREEDTMPTLAENVATLMERVDRLEVSLADMASLYARTDELYRIVDELRGLVIKLERPIKGIHLATREIGDS